MMKRVTFLSFILFMCMTFLSCSIFAPGGAVSIGCAYAQNACAAVTQLCSLLETKSAGSVELQAARADVEKQVNLILRESDSKIQFLKKAGQ